LKKSAVLKPKAPAKIWAEVKEKILCSRGRVYKLMKQADIQSHRKEK
jgi:hypothetical protein